MGVDYFGETEILMLVYFFSTLLNILLKHYFYSAIFLHCLGATITLISEGLFLSFYWCPLKSRIILERKYKTMSKVIVFTDGGARGNPGPAASECLSKTKKVKS